MASKIVSPVQTTRVSSRTWRVLGAIVIGLITVIVVGIGGYLGAVFGTPAGWQPVWWLLCYGLFVALNVWGVEMTFHVSVFVTLAALTVLLVFWIGAAPHFDLGRWAAPYFPPGSSKARAAFLELPFALWLYLGIEQLPLAAEESHDPTRDMPRGILYGLITLIVISFLTVILSAGIALFGILTFFVF